MDRGEFNLIESKLNKISEQYKLNKIENAFYYFVLKEFFDIEEGFDEIITDSNYLQTMGLETGEDLGIDMIIIEEGKKKEPLIALFNFKHHGEFENAKNNFPANETSKIETFITKLKEQDKSLLIGVGPNLKTKIMEIWGLFNQGKIPKFKIFLVHNGYEGLEKTAEKRFREYLQTKNTDLEYLNLDNFTEIYLDKKFNIDSSILVEKKDFFEKRSDGNISALILCLNASDVLRILSPNKEEREDVLASFKENNVDENVFDENVRIFKKIKGKIDGISDENDINRNIEQTALDQSRNPLFFYYNNGITIVCDEYRYDPSNNKITISIKNLQVVNGQQTILSLLSAFKKNKEVVSNVHILCKIYKTTNKNNKIEVAEFTNSQNPVNRRDIRSVDRTQRRIEEELKEKGFFYERKKNQFENESPDKRLDSLLIGQILLSFFNKDPTSAKNNKTIIFGKEYKEVFNEDMNADKILFAWDLYQFIESKRKERAKKLEELFPLDDIDKEEEYYFGSYIKYCSFFYLYIIKELLDLDEVPITILSKTQKEDYYEKADKILNAMIDKKYASRLISPNYGPFFKNPESIRIFEEVFKKYKEAVC